MSCCSNPRNTPNRHMRRGPRGESAYEFWKKLQPEGADTSECAFLEYTKGKKGDDGQSFHEWWVSKQPEGADTSDDAFMEAMKGKPGEPGKSVIVAKAESTQVDGGTQVSFTLQIEGQPEDTLTIVVKDGITIAYDYDVITLNLGADGAPLAIDEWYPNVSEIVEKHIADQGGATVYKQSLQDLEAAGSNIFEAIIRITPRASGGYEVFVNGITLSPMYILTSPPRGTYLWMESVEESETYGDGYLLSWGGMTAYMPMDRDQFTTRGASGTEIGLLLSSKEDNAIELDLDEETKGFYVPKQKTVEPTIFDKELFTTKKQDGHTVTTLKRDIDEQNQLHLLEDGLFCRPTSIQVRTADKSMTARPIKQSANGGINTEFFVNISPNEGNALTLVGNGLYVTAGATGITYEVVQLDLGGSNQSQVPISTWNIGVQDTVRDHILEERKDTIYQQMIIDEEAGGTNINLGLLIIHKSKNGYIVEANFLQSSPYYLGAPLVGSYYHTISEEIDEEMGSGTLLSYTIEPIFYPFSLEDFTSRGAGGIDIGIRVSPADGNKLTKTEDGLFVEDGGDLDSKYIKVGEAADNKADAVGGGDGTIVIGSGAGNGEMGPANKTTVVGSLAKSLDDGGSVFGYNCSATGKQALAAGYACSAQGDNSVALGNTASAALRGGIAIGWGTNALDTDSIAIGRNAKVNGNSSIAIGVGAVTAAQNTILLGTGASATGTNGIAIGQNTKSVFNSIVIGPLAEATGGNSTLLGYGAKAAQGGTSIGHSAQATGAQSLAIAVNSTASGENTVAVGCEAKATHNNAVAVGYAAETDREQSFSVGNASMPRQITHVAPATEKTDGPNWEQVQNLTQITILKSTKEKPISLGSLKGPMTYRISEGDYNAETNPLPYTITDAPNFADRSGTIEVYVHTDGKLQYCKTPDQSYSRQRGVSGPRGAWGIVTNDKTAPSYFFGGVTGAYWTSYEGIFTKDKESIVIGTAESPVDTMFVPIMSPLARGTGNGVLMSVSHAYGYNGKVKLLLNRRTGTPTGTAPRDDETFNYSMVSDAFKKDSDNVLEYLAKAATPETIVERVNQLIRLLDQSGIAITKPAP